YFVIPYTIGDYLAGTSLPFIAADHDAFATTAAEVEQRVRRLTSIRGEKSPREIHRELGRIMWNYVGMSRNAEGLRQAVEAIRGLRDEFWQNLRVPGDVNHLNKYLEFAGRVADFLELAELMAIDALHREESCGGHFREEYQTEEGEAVRNDRDFAYVAAWEFTGVGREPTLHKEPLVFENVPLSVRSYK
ncbi:MAG TPA: fumarate reductase/succinate dehydrogenase flavoprotein subunit, partial [Acidobacteriota bacterium]|nr:fumarate reductase/succinate dehydrogenase flavoprotein subunit [Acidobacteriota bacterium]